MALDPTKLASAIGLAVLLAVGAALAQTRSPTSPRRPDCAAFPPTSEAYRDCIAGRAIRDPTGRRGTSPGAMGTDPAQPGSPTTPNPPGLTPPGGSGTTPGTGLSRPGSGTGLPDMAPGTPPNIPGSPGSGSTGTGR
jgi:hypothetical protein